MIKKKTRLISGVIQGSLEDVGSVLACRKKKRLFFAFFRRITGVGGGEQSQSEGEAQDTPCPDARVSPSMPTFHLPLPAWKRRKKKLPTYPSLTGTAVEERLNCLTILYFHFPHLTSSSAILIFSMCTRRWFNILPRIWSPIIPESRSPISSCHFTSKEGQDPWCIPRGGTRRKIG